jgi:hypothetical protein
MYSISKPGAFGIIHFIRWVTDACRQWLHTIGGHRDAKVWQEPRALRSALPDLGGGFADQAFNSKVRIETVCQHSDLIVLTS